jgi:hypothetical protein
MLGGGCPCQDKNAGSNNTSDTQKNQMKTIEHFFERL